MKKLTKEQIVEIAKEKKANTPKLAKFVARLPEDPTQAYQEIKAYKTMHGNKKSDYLAAKAAYDYMFLVESTTISDKKKERKEKKTKEKAPSKSAPQTKGRGEKYKYPEDCTDKKTYRRNIRAKKAKLEAALENAQGDKEVAKAEKELKKFRKEVFA